MRKKLFSWVSIMVILIASVSLAAPIPPDAKSIVTFIFVQGEKGLIANGTGFIIALPSKEKDLSFLYLVTAKHVILQKDAKTFFPYVYVRVNKKNGGAEMLRLDFVPEGKSKNIFMHGDASVDIVVIPLSLDTKKYDVKFLHVDFIHTKDEFKKLKMREGSDIFFTGLFTAQFNQDIADQRNYPIVRFGKIALITDERINWVHLDAELYLIESAAYGGNSGSPVFLYSNPELEPGRIMISGSPIFELIGVMVGAFGEDNPVKFIEATNKIPVVSSNIGISAVVPAYKIHDIIFSQELRKSRGF